jgi:segregation and condensation protein A
MAEETYQVTLTDVFEGPMDLLLHLIKKNEVNIYDIPIAAITKQYLEYLEWMKALNIDFAGEFIVMASTLTQVKSRMLLPAVSEADGEEEDPRMEIVRPLTEYLQMKSAAEILAQRTLLGEGTFTRTSGEVRQLFTQDDQLIQIGLFELIDAFQQILTKIAPEERLDLTADRISVKDRIRELVDIFEKKQSLTFEELFSEHPNRSEVIVTFLAILEMVKLALIRLAQHSQTGVIRLFYQ